MFRRLMVLIAALAVAGAGWSAQAAPISGSATLDIIFEPALAYAGGTSTKIDKINVKVELDLLLTLSVSGIDITSASTFTFRGLEYQAFIFTGTVGALAFRAQMIFAPNIIEIELVRDSLGLPAYCINLADPVIVDDQIPPLDTGLPACDPATPDYFAEHYLYYLIEGIDAVYGYIHPALRNWTLARIMEAQATDPLGMPLTFRKKIAEINLSLAGLTVGLRGLFANIGSPQTPDWSVGIVASVEGQTVSGIVIRGESWIGAMQGVECFAECKPNEIVRGGKVITDFVFTEEKLFIRNLNLAGVIWGARLEFQFYQAPVGLNFVELTQTFKLAPLGLTINNTMNIFGPTLTIASDTIVTTMKIGDVAATLIGYIWPDFTGAFNLFWSRLITTFDPPGMKVTSDIAFCNDEMLCPFTYGPLLYHTIYLSGAVGDMSIDIQLSLSSLLSGFTKAIVDLTWKAGSVSVKSSTIVNAHYLDAQAFSITFAF